MQLNSVTTVGFYEGSGTPSSTDNISLQSRYLDTSSGIVYTLTATGWQVLFDPSTMVVLPASPVVLPASVYYTVSSKIITGDWNLSGLGITHFDSSTDDGSALSNYIYGLFVDPPHSVFDLSGNALPTADIDAILARLALSTVSCPSGIPFLSGLTFDLSGGTNGVPTGGSGNTDIITLQGRGATVSTN